MPSPTMILRKGLWIASPTPSGLADAGIALNANFVMLGDAIETLTTFSQPYLTDTGTAVHVVLTPDPPITAYALGQKFRFKAAYTKTLSCLLAIRGLSNT